MTEMIWLMWFAAGVLLALLELILPGFIILFFGVGCWVVAIVLLVGVDIGLAGQFALFLVGSVGSLVLLRRWMMRTFRGSMTDCPEQEFDDQPIGQIVTVAREIRPPQAGRIMYRGTEWDATAEEPIAAGEQVEIMGRDDRALQRFRVRSIQTNKEK